MLVWGEKEAKEFSKDIFEDNIFKELEKLFDDEENQGAINVLMNHVVNTHYMEIYEVPKNKKPYLSDNPVIVNDITGLDYFLPISSNYAIVLKKIPKGDFNLHYTPLVMSGKMTDSVNRLIIQNASREIIVQDMTVSDEKFITDSRNN